MHTGLTQVDTKIVVESLLDSIITSLCSGKNIEIRGFGRFKIKKKKSRVARNPRTGETVFVLEGLKPVFEASKELKKAMNVAGKKPDSAPGAKKDSKKSSSSPIDQEPLY
jgi:DNA-binding protein HU-beta/integration host factor subunit beta